ncbi:hypothetical protein ACVWVY_008122 [Bradyrhizobium sp. URHC0002]
MKGEIRTAPASALAMPAPGSAERHVTLHTLALENLCSAYSLPRRCEFDEHALGSHASLLVGFDNLAPLREYWRKVGVHLGGLARVAARLDADGDCEPVGSRDSDACSVAAPFSSPRQCFFDNIPVLEIVDSIQDDRAIGSCSLPVFRRDTAPRSPVSPTMVVIARSWFSFGAKAFSFRCRRKPLAGGRRAKPLSCRRVALFYALRVTSVVGPSFVRWALPTALPRTSRPPPR